MSSDPGYPLSLQDLTGVAVRRNPRRTQLLVSRVLGRHYPTSPSALRAAGQLLAHHAAAALQGSTPSAGVDDVASALRDMLQNPSRATEEQLHRAVDELPAALDGSASAPVVIAFAEAATGLGHAVSAALTGSTYIHSTHTDPTGFSGHRLEFQEPHSHSADHLILPGDHVSLGGDRPLVLVDDEVSTGTTIMNTIETLQALHTRDRYVVATLIDLRSEDDRRRTEEFARELNIDLDIVTLASGFLQVPETATTIGNEFVAIAPGAEPRTWSFHPGETLTFAWPPYLPAEVVHGVTFEQTTAIHAASKDLAAFAAAALKGTPARVLIMGVEEFQFVPSLVAYELESLLLRATVDFGAVTRSPVVALNRPGYPVRSVVSATGTVDSADTRFLYNVAGPRLYDAIVLLLPPTTSTTAALAAGGVVRTLSGLTPELLAVQL